MTTTRAIAVPAPAHPSSSPIATLFDTQLHGWLEERRTTSQIVFLVESGHRCAVFHENDRTVWPADPDEDAIKLLSALAKARRLKQITVPLDELVSATHAPDTWIQQAVLMNAKTMNAWEKARDGYFDEKRGKDLSEKAVRQIWHAAGGRCMFEGCGKDLGRTALTTKIAKIAYLAHIVAADKDGPRGDNGLSFNLSDDPENIMLMCDEHHRYIDRIAVDEYPAARLNAMRKSHVQFVENQLNALAYPRTQAIAFLGNIASIPTDPSERDMQDAVLDLRLSPLSGIEYPLAGFHRDDRLPPDFWRHLLRQHELDIARLVKRFDGTHPTQERFACLSAFPLTAVPLLLLCGRIVGEGRPVKVFQYDFSRGSFRWDAAQSSQPPGTFYFEKPQDYSQVEQVLLSVELTAELEEAALSTDLAEGVKNGSVQWLRIRATKPNGRCIGHPDDLEQFTAAAREALAFAQDGLRAQRIHLIGIAPASSLFRYGQLLRPGHHSIHVFYDRPDRNLPFRPALTLTGHEVADAAPSDDGRITIKLR